MISSYLARHIERILGYQHTGLCFAWFVGVGGVIVMVLWSYAVGQVLKLW